MKFVIFLKIEQMNKTLTELQDENEKLLDEKLERTNQNQKLAMEAEIVKNEVSCSFVFLF